MPTPAQNIASVAAAYANAAKGGGPGLAARDAQPKSDFAALVKGAVEGAIETGKQGERMSIDAVNESADLNQVVTAVAEANKTRKRNVKLLVGGPPIDQEFSDRHGADGYGMDATAGVALARDFVST